MFMSSMYMRGLLCLAIAFAVLASVGVWTYHHSHTPAAPIKLVMQQKPAAIAAVVAPQREPMAGGNPRRFAPKIAVPQGEEPIPFEEQPRFFQKGGGKGFGKKAPRATLSERLGVRFEKPSEDTVLQTGIADTDGLIVEAVFGGSLAEFIGMKVGDILLTLDGQNVPSDVEQFHFQLENLKTNEAIDATLLRDGKMQTLKGLILPEAPQRSFPFQRKVF